MIKDANLWVGVAENEQELRSTNFEYLWKPVPTGKGDETYFLQSRWNYAGFWVGLDESNPKKLCRCDEKNRKAFEFDTSFPEGWRIRIVGAPEDSAWVVTDNRTALLETGNESSATFYEIRVFSPYEDPVRSLALVNSKEPYPFAWHQVKLQNRWELSGDWVKVEKGGNQLCVLGLDKDAIVWLIHPAEEREMYHLMNKETEQWIGFTSTQQNRLLSCVDAESDRVSFGFVHADGDVFFIECNPYSAYEDRWVGYQEEDYKIKQGCPASERVPFYFEFLDTPKSNKSARK